ncbi:WXG100 family type VII secretion target [Actinosynnema sp. NPDC050436]|uniref:WXG100 family type VII secretion target n=1 Tax=Actinosynnema sp. NPDC050436 TaxID=3155659 RepID=UPI0033E8317D
MVDHEQDHLMPEIGSDVPADLTFEQAAQAVNEVSPDVFYLRAAAFDRAAEEFQDVLDRMRRRLNAVQDVWTGRGSDEFDALAREVSGRVAVVSQFLRGPGYGSVLRGAGDVLAAHQQRFRDLAARRAQRAGAPPGPPPEAGAGLEDESARQILRDLRTAYHDVGKAMAPLPHAAPQVVGAPGVGRGTEAPAPPLSAASAVRYEVAPMAAVVPVSGAGRYRAGGATGDVLGRRAAVEQPSGAVRFERAETGHVSQASAAPVQEGTQPRGRSAPEHCGEVGYPVSRLEGAHPVPGRDRATPPSSRKGTPLDGGVPATAGVLGRPEKRPEVPRASGKSKLKDRRDNGDPATPQVVQRPDTVSTGAAPAPGTVTTGAPGTVVAGAPGTAGPHGADLVVKAIATEPAAVAGVPTVPGIPTAPGAAAVAVPELPAVAGASGVPAAAADAAPAHFAVPGHGGQSPAVSPPERGTPAGVPEPPLTSRTVDSSAVPPGGYPMSPMMFGGAAGQAPQQNARTAAMPTEPRPEFWDSAEDSGVLGGRPPAHRAPAPDPVDGDAALADKLAELDRLVERGR